MWIKIFKSGRHRDSMGRESEYLIEVLDEIVAKFNSSIEQNGYIAPLVIGHPASNQPAHDWVERLARRGNILLVSLKELSEGIIEDVRAGKYKKVSVAMYPDFLLRHVGLLGAVQPAVQGLEAISFSDDVSDLLCFENNFHSQIDDDNEQKVAALQEEICNLKNEIGRLQNIEKNRHYSDYANSFFAQNKFLATNQEITEQFKDLLIKADNASTISKEFYDGSDLINNFIHFFDSLKPAHLFETIHANYSNSANNDDFGGRKVNQARLEQHNKALALVAENPEMTYQQAINQLQNK